MSLSSNDWEAGVLVTLTKKYGPIETDRNLLKWKRLGYAIRHVFLAGTTEDGTPIVEVILYPTSHPLPRSDAEPKED